MDETTANTRNWRVTIVRAAAWGFGFGAAVAIVLGIMIYVVNRPRGWDTKTLVFKNSKLEQFGVSTDGKTKWIWLTADIQNRSGADVTLAKDTRVMGRKAGTRTLDTSTFHLSRDYFLPAHETTAVTLDDDLYCESGKTTDYCFQRSLGGVDEVVLFDDIGKYETRATLPKRVEGTF